MSPTNRKFAILVVAILLSFWTNQVFAEDQSLGRVRIGSFVCPGQVAPGATFSVNLDIEYEVRTNATIRAVILDGMANAPVWQSDVANVSGGGDKVWRVNVTAPFTEGTMRLSAFAYYLADGLWKFYNDTILGPGFRDVIIKVARNASLEVVLGLSGVQLTLGNISATTSRTGEAGVSLPIGVTYSLSVPPVLEYGNSTRSVFHAWQDGSNQTNRIISLDEDTKLVASYQTQYLLLVTSTLPSHSYQKWYDVGENVSLRETESVPMYGPLGLLGGKYSFSGWTGDVNSGSTQVNFTMKSPARIQANFVIVYGTLIVFPIIIAAGIAGEVILLAMKRRKTVGFEPESVSSAPACPNCGAMVKQGRADCLECGAKLDSFENEIGGKES